MQSIDYIFGWNVAESPRNQRLLTKIRNVGVNPLAKPSNEKLVTDLLSFYDPRNRTSQWAIFTTNRATLLSEVENAVATAFCLTYGLSINYLTPQIIFDSLRQRSNEEAEPKDIYSGAFVVFSEVDKAMKSLAYHKGTLSNLFRHWIKNNTMVLLTSTYKVVHTEKDRTFMEAIEFFYGEVAASVAKQATFFTHQSEEKDFIKFNKIG